MTTYSIDIHATTETPFRAETSNGHTWLRVGTAVIFFRGTDAPLAEKIEQLVADHRAAVARAASLAGAG